MKTLTTATTVLLLLAISMPVHARNQRSTKRNSLTESDTAALLFMREEEKLARDVYLEMHEQWGNTIFANIAQSEQRHMDAILNLLDKYGLSDPAKDRGEFSDPELQLLYDELIAQGSASRLDAFRVGALIEEVDIEDLLDAQRETENSDLGRVYANLLSGSENHLRAFVRNITRIDETYTAHGGTLERADSANGATTFRLTLRSSAT